MGRETGISWADATFNPWIGCTKVSPACDHCYAAEWAKRFAQDVTWGEPGIRAKHRRTSKANWHQPLKWERQHEEFFKEHGRRRRVFCASLADVFDNQVPPQWLRDVWALIKATPHLDWLILTKRPQNMRGRMPDDWGDGWDNVWLGTTVENQEEVKRRIPHLQKIPAAVHFLSCEPLLEEIKVYLWLATPGVWWVICGDESGNQRRIAKIEWVEYLFRQCQITKTPFFFKQFNGKAEDAVLHGKVIQEFPNG